MSSGDERQALGQSLDRKPRRNRRKMRRQIKVAAQPADVARARADADDRSHGLPAATADCHVE